MTIPTRPELVGSYGMIAGTHWLGVGAGMSVLEAGGNAFDAAVAAGFVLQVVEPHLSGPAGEVPIVLWSAKDERAEVICGQGVAPAQATPAMFIDLGLDMIPGTGLLPATVPGAFGGWMLLLERHGTMRLRDVLRYAIGYARSGFPVAPLLAVAIDSVAEMFAVDWPTSRAQWLLDGAAPRPGTRFRLPTLADTYERVLREAEAMGHDRETEIQAAVHVWYEGFVAELIASFCSRTQWLDTSGRAHGGLLTLDDLGAWSASVEAPTSLAFDEFEVFKTGVWGQGPVMLQQLSLLQHLSIGDVPYGSPDYLHLMIEAAKLAFADREAWYGDSGNVPNLVEHLLAPAYAAERAQLVDDTASFQLRPGRVAGFEPHVPDFGDLSESSLGAGEPTLGPTGPVRGDTCHVDVVDHYGNMVSATPSGAWLQSSPTIPTLGFCLGTRGQMFTTETGHPNSLRPFARPRTTLTPSFATRGGEPWLAFGTPGGDQQDQWSLAFLCSVIYGDLGLQDAIDAPAFTSFHFPSSFYPRTSRPGHLAFEDRFGDQVIDSLRSRGHVIETVAPWELGRLSAVSRDADGFVRAGANTRGRLGYAAGR